MKLFYFLAVFIAGFRSATVVSCRTRGGAFVAKIKQSVDRSEVMEDVRFLCAARTYEPKVGWIYQELLPARLYFCHKTLSKC